MKENQAVYDHIFSNLLISLGNPLKAFTEESGQLIPEIHAVQYSVRI